VEDRLALVAQVAAGLERATLAGCSVDVESALAGQRRVLPELVELRTRAGVLVERDALEATSDPLSAHNCLNAVNCPGVRADHPLCRFLAVDRNQISQVGINERS